MNPIVVRRVANKLPPGPGKGTLDEHSISNAHKSPPARHAAGGATKPSDYADPSNYKYPLVDKNPTATKKKVNAALKYFSREADKTYTKPQQKSVAKRILQAALKNGIEVSNDWRQKFGLPIMKAKSRTATLPENKRQIGAIPGMNRVAHCMSRSAHA